MGNWWYWVVGVVAISFGRKIRSRSIVGVVDVIAGCSR